MNLHEVKEVTGGSLSGGDAVFDSVSINTRTLEPGDLFVAISGPNFDGNDFVEAAAAAQASAVLVSKPVAAVLPTLTVGDTRKALGALGAYNREQSNVCLIGITGSQGKTTVKEMVAAILANRGDVLVTRGNLNNDLGVPLTLLRIGAHHDYAVIELGASAAGEIAYSSNLARPDIAHITNAAATHLEGFGTLADVARAKGEIWDNLKPGGTAIVNLDDKFAVQWCERARNRTVVTISASGNTAADYYVTQSGISADHCACFTFHCGLGDCSVRLDLLGRHNVANALAAAAISLQAGSSMEDVEKGLMNVQAVPGRLCRRPGLNGSLLIDDSYNASPSSFHAAIDVLEQFPGERILAIGDMAELGPQAEEAHREIGRYARGKGIDRLFATGSMSRLAAEAFGDKAVHSPDRDKLADLIVPGLKRGVTILVKGSRSAGMEKLVQQLTGVTGPENED